MRKDTGSIFILILLAAGSWFLNGCGNNRRPDVSGIPVDIRINRFDKAFFENPDTANAARYLAALEQEFPRFTNDFCQYILGLPPLGSSDSVYPAYDQLLLFNRISRPLYDSVSRRFNETAIKKLEKELEQAFKYVKYYFPDYQVPSVVTYVGPFDAPAVAIMPDALAIGLQLFAGKDFSFYTSTEGQELYPMYISRRFEPAYIIPGCMKAVTGDIFPDNSQGRPLIEQMVEKGKLWYMLNRLLPDAPDSLLTDYTQQQLNWVNDNEGLVWNFLLQQQYLYITDPAIIKNFIGEAPSTYGMPEISPGNIGQWIGWQIVERYAEKAGDLSPATIMTQDAQEIFRESKYKPR